MGGMSTSVNWRGQGVGYRDSHGFGNNDFGTIPTVGSLSETHKATLVQ